MSESLTGKVAVVTGAARGIGRACALRLAAEGANVILNDCAHSGELNSLAAVIEASERRALICQTDVSDASATKAMFSSVQDSFGRLDILINNAARSVRKPFLELPLEEAKRTFDVTFWGSFQCAQEAAKLMTRSGGGSIVMVSSVHAERPYPNAAPYNAAKAALNHLSASLALELAPHRIRVNAIEPGWIDTPGERLHNTEEQIEERKQTLPMGRLGTVEEIADAVAYLCSENASYITGSTLRVDGGFALRF